MNSIFYRNRTTIQVLRMVGSECSSPFRFVQKNNNSRRRGVLEKSVNRRFASLQRAAISDEEDNDEEVLVQRLRESRPRLAALRKRLLNEDAHSKKPLQSFVDHHKNDQGSPSISSPASSPVRMDHSKQPHLHSSEYPLLHHENAAAQLLPARDTDTVLLDRFHRKHTYLRLSLTERCNLRCTYCMPEHGVPLQPESHLLQTQEILYLAEYFANAGVTKFRLTGGEPTLRKDLIDIVHGIAQLQPKEFVGMTTNGITLYKHLPQLVQAGLQSVNISLDTLKPSVFEQLTRRPASYLNRVLDSLHMALDMAAPTMDASSSSLPQQQQQQKQQNRSLSVKLNCVVMRGINDKEVVDFIRLTDQYPHLKVRFIEYMPFAENGWNTEKYIGYKELLSHLDDAYDEQLIPGAVFDKHDTTKWFTTGGSGQIGFITSMSNPFCGGCNRLRITADGQLKTCLFGSTQEEHDAVHGHGSLSLRDALRSGQTPQSLPLLLDKIIVDALQKKHYKLGGHANPLEISAHSDENRPMTLIGG